MQDPHFSTSGLPASYISCRFEEVLATYSAPHPIVQHFKTTHVRPIGTICQSDCILTCEKETFPVYYYWMPKQLGQSSRLQIVLCVIAN